jgi:hypothetical protein
MLLSRIKKKKKTAMYYISLIEVSNKLSIVKNLQILNFRIIKKNSTQLINSFQKFDKPRNNLFYFETIHVLRYG